MKDIKTIETKDTKTIETMIEGIITIRETIKSENMRKNNTRKNKIVTKLNIDDSKTKNIKK